MEMFEFGADDSARTTEGWVKHDLEAGDLHTYWLRNAVSDSLDAPRDYNVSPVEYMEALLSNVNVPDQAKIRALLFALVGVMSDINWPGDQ